MPCIVPTVPIGQRVTANNQILRLLLPSLLWRNSSKLTLALGTDGCSSPRVSPLECRGHTAISVKSIRPRKRLKARTEREVIGLAAGCLRSRGHAGE